MAFNKIEHCKKELAIQKDYFMYDGEKYVVDYIMTYNISLNNEGSPFVYGCNVEEPTNQLKLKTFLVDEWVD